MRKLTCIIVDDDEMSRATIEHYVTQTDFLHLEGVCSSAIEALNLLKQSEIDILFLDIEMPGMSGLDLLESMVRIPSVVLITSKEEYAVKAFEYDVIDYLLKPIEYVRFLKAVNKVSERLHETTIDKNDIFIKSDLKFVKINFTEILYVEAMADYVVIHIDKSKHIIHSTMKAIEKKLSTDYFVRVHRSYIVNIRKIDTVENATIVIKDKRIPVGASYKNDFMNKLKIL